MEEIQNRGMWQMCVQPCRSTRDRQIGQDIAPADKVFSVMSGRGATQCQIVMIKAPFAEGGFCDLF